MIRAADIIQAVGAAQLRSRPFPHLRLSCVFGKEEYRDIRRLLPGNADYAELRHKDARLPDGTFSRLEFQLTGERLARLDPNRRRYWSEFAAALRHGNVARAFAARFAELKCDVPLEKGSTLRLSLVRDFPGYFIRPHQDVPSKLLTVQIYLPQDDGESDRGTIFYRRGDSGLLEIDSTVPYLPNSGYAFPVTEGSWHGVDPIPPGAPPRDSLMLVWYVEGAWKKLEAAARQARRWLRK